MKTARVRFVAAMIALVGGVVFAAAAPDGDNDRGEARANRSAAPAAPPAGVARIEQTSPQADGMMARAAKYLEAGELDNAAQTLQRAIDTHGDALTFTPQGHYLQTRRAAERVLAGWARSAPGALRAYRVEADASAKALIGDGPPVSADEAKLREVVDRYMLSRLGDDAALALAGLLIDRGDHAEALGLLRRLAGERGSELLHPDPSVSTIGVWARTAVAASGIGDRRQAAHALAALREARAPDALIAALTRRLPAEADAGTDESAPAQLERPAAAGGAADATFEPLWRADAGQPYDRVAAAFAVPGRGAPGPRSRLARRWREEGWRPTTAVRFAGDRMLFRAGIELVCIDPATGRRQWTTTLAADQRPSPPRLLVTNPSPTNNPRPERPGEILLFGDELSAAFTVDDRRAYVVEPIIDNERVVIHRGRRIIPVGNFAVALPGNRLTAIDLRDGSVLWRAAIPSEQARGSRSKLHANLPTHIIAEPVVWNDRLLTVVDDQGEVALAALRRDDGRLLWRRTLCVHAPDNATDWAPSRLAIDGSTVYLATGRGLVLAADAATGRLIWGYPYHRGEGNGEDVIQRAVAAAVDDGWHENRALLAGRTVVATGADARRLMLLDAATGRPLELERERDSTRRVKADQLRYIVGQADGRLYIGGTNRIHCFNVEDRTFSWSSSIGERPATGRALLSGDAIIVPVDDALVWLDAQSGKRLGEATPTNDDGDPLGNLASDGERLFAVGIDRARAIGDPERTLAELAQRIADNQPGAMLQRARFLERRGRIDEAVDAWRRSLKSLEEGPRREAARRSLIANLLTRVADKPEAEGAADRIALARQVAADPAKLRRIDLAEADWRRATGQIVKAALAYRALAAARSEALVEADPSRPGRRVRVDAAASSRLEAMTAGEQGAAVIGALQEPAAEALASLDPDDDVEGLLRVATAHPRTEAAAEAVARLGGLGRDEKHERFASVELALRGVAAGPPRPEADEAVRQLAETYLARGWAPDAKALVDRRAAAGRPVEMPRALADRIEAAAAKAPVDGERLAEPPLKRDVVCDDADARLLRLTATRRLDHSTFLRKHAFVHRTKANRLLRYDPSNGFRLSAEIELPADASDLAFHGRNNAALVGGVDGHILLALSPSRTVAIDLVAGAVAWQREADRSEITPDLVARAAESPVDAMPGFLAIGGGRFAELTLDPKTGRGRVVVRDLLTGLPRWDRPMGDDRPIGLYFTQGRLVIVTAGARPSATLCDASTGRRIGTVDPLPVAAAVEYQYRRPRDRELGFNPRVAAGIAQGADHRPLVRPGMDTERLTDAGLVSLDGRTVALAPFDDRAAAWKRQFAKRDRPRDLIELGRDMLLIKSMSGLATLVDTPTGKVHWKTHDQQFGRYVFNAWLDPGGGRLHLLIADDRGRLALVEADAESGRLHASTPLGALPRTAHSASPRTLARSGPYLPRFIRASRGMEGTLVLIKRSSGERVEGAIEGAGAWEALRQPPRIRGSALVLATDRGIVAYTAAKD